MDVNSVYLNVMDRVSPETNGSLGIQEYNRYSKLAELRLLEWLTGNISGQPGYPEPFTTRKISDFLSPFIKTEKKQVENGIAEKPSDYYLWQRAAIIGDRLDELCGETVEITGVDTPIERFDSETFDARSQTHIKSLRPSIRKPITKLVGDSILCLPKDLGSIAIEYVRYPVFGQLKTMIDPIFNNEVVDVAGSTPYEWKEYARELLVFFITEQYPIKTRESALQQQVQAVRKTATP